MASFGIKANVKKSLRQRGIKEVYSAKYNRMVKLDQAKTIDLIKADKQN